MSYMTFLNNFYRKYIFYNIYLYFIKEFYTNMYIKLSYWYLRFPIRFVNHVDVYFKSYRNLDSYCKF